MAGATLVPVDEGTLGTAKLTPAPDEDAFSPARDNVVNGTFGSPDKAGKGAILAPAVGQPASTVALDPESYQRDKNREDGLKAIKTKTLLERFAERSAIHAEIAADDWSNATQMADQIGWLRNAGHEKKVDAALYAGSPEGHIDSATLKKFGSPFAGYAAHVKENAKANSDAFWSAFGDKSRVDMVLNELEEKKIIDYRTRYMWELSMIPTAGRAIEGLMMTGVGALKALGSEFAGKFIDVGGEKATRKLAETVFTEDGSGLDDVSGPKKFREDVQHLVDSELIRSMTDHPMTITRAQVIERFQAQANKWLTDPKFGELSTELRGFQETGARSSVVNDVTEFLRQRTTGQWDPSKFTSPELKVEVMERAAAKPVGEPIKAGDSVAVVKAEVAAETLNSAIEVAKESKILKRSPQVFDDLINSEGNAGTVFINAQAIADLYKGAKKEPAAGDGLLGDVPGLMERVAKAVSTGAEVGIPLSRYIIAAAQNPTMHTALTEHLRLHSDGTTLAEAQVLKKTEPHFGEVHPDVISHLATLQPEAFAQTKPVETMGKAEVSEPVEAAEVEGEKPTEVTAAPAGPKSAIQRELEAEEAVQLAKEQAAKEQAKTGEEPEPEPKAGTMEAKEAGAVETTTEGLAPAKQETKSRPGANLGRLAQLLGPKLYGDPTNMDEVVVKEMLQNSFDAIKGLIEKGLIKDAKIDIVMDQDKRTVTITDNGSGMTAETLGGPFLRIADSLKETESSSGGFGIAKMLWVFGNKEIRVTTMRDGQISTLITSGEKLFLALEDPTNAPSITTVPAIMFGKGRGENWKDIFPNGHGTRVEVVVPESFKDPSSGEQKGIEFRTTSDYGQHNAVMKSPLFRDIEVSWSRRPGRVETLPIGKNFPYEDFTQFANVNFDWGTARIYLSKAGSKDAWGDNVQVLSNGIHQFGLKLPADPTKPYGKNLDKDLYIDVASKATPTEPGYPFDLNRQGFTKSANEDLKKILNYFATLHRQADLSTAVKNFGDVEYYGPDGKSQERIRLEPAIPAAETALTAAKEEDKIEVKDGKLYVKGRIIPELTGDDLKASKINLDELKMDQGSVDPSRVMLHDNVEIFTGPNGWASLVTLGREQFGLRFDNYVHGVGQKFLELRDIVSREMSYPKLAEEAIGISFDKEYRGVSIKIPFDGMFLNPAAPKYLDPLQAAFGMVGTMIHEFAHHRVRSHDADFPAEMQDIIIKLDVLEAREAERTTLGQPIFSLVKFKQDVAQLVKDHEDVLKWLNEKLTADDFQQIPYGKSEPEQPLVRNRGKRFKDSGSRQGVDADVPRDGGEPTETVPGGYEALRPALQELGGEPKPGDVAKGDRGTEPREPTEIDKAIDDVVETPGATQAAMAIKRERRSLYLDPILTRGKTLNIDQTMYRRLSDLVERKELHILEKAIEIARRRAKQEVSAAWKEEEAKLTPKVERALLNTPPWKADRYFNWDKGNIGGGKRLPAKDMTQLGADGVESWAEFFGFESGSEMVTAVLQLETQRADNKWTPQKQLTAHVQDAVRTEMEARHGTLNDAISIAASEEALASWNLDLLDQELKMLAEAHGVEPPLTRDQLNAWQAENFGREIASDVSYNQLARETERNGKGVEKALLKEDPTEALMKMQDRIKSYLLAREAKKFEKERDKAERLFDKYSSSANLPRVDQEYTDQIQKLLNTVGWEMKRTLGNIDHNLGGKSVQEFIGEKARQGRLIVEAHLPTTEDGGIKKLEEFTVNEYRDFVTMIQSLDHNGRFEKVIEVRGKKEDFYGVIDRIAKALDSMAKEGFDPFKEGSVSSVRSLTRYVDAKLLKAENLISWIDKFDPLGTFTSVVIRPLIEAEHAKGDMLTKLSALARAIPGDMKWSHSLNDRVPTNTNYSLRDEMGQIIQHTNEQKLAIALNYGNQGNRDVLTRAHGWTEANVEAYLANTMSATDWAVVNAIHDLFKPLAPLVEAATRERSGVAIPLVDPLPFLGSNGGYFPLVRDPRDVVIGVKQNVDLFDKTRFDPLPMAPALKERTGKVYKLNLSLNTLNGMLSQTTHAALMQGPVVNANKVLKDPFVREGIVQAFGPEYVDMLDQWIKDIANNGGEHDSGVMSWISRNVRQNVVTQLMGYKVSTALIHGGSAAASSVYELGKLHMEERGAKAFALAPIELAANIKKLNLGNLPQIAQQFLSSDRFTQLYDEAQAQSGELRNRQRTAQSNLEFQLGTVLRKNYLDEVNYWKGMYQSYSMAMVSYIDLLSATPVWLAVRDTELRRGKSLEDAIFLADKAVREAHGSASLVSRANVGRGEGMKWLTIAYNGYWNHNYNKYRSEYHALTDAGDVPRIGRQEIIEPGQPDSFGREHDFERDAEETEARLRWGVRVAMGSAFLTAFIIVPSIVHHAVRGKQEETLAGTIASMGFSQLMGTIPVLNSLTYAMIHHRDPAISPIDDVLKSAADVYKDLVSKKPAKKPLSHAFKAAGYFTGFAPTNQMLDTGSFVNEVLSGRKRIETPGQWARGILAVGDKGKKP